jgi:hypothetical protein
MDRKWRTGYKIYSESFRSIDNFERGQTMTAADDEIARLRQLLWDNGIDPDPAPPELPQYGPPTEFEWTMHKLFQRSSQYFANLLEEQTKTLDWLSGSQWAPGEVKIKIPRDHIVTMNKTGTP